MAVRRLVTAFTIVAGSGALSAVVFTVISGVRYRIREDQGLQPQYAPGWIVYGTYAGLWLCALGVAGLALTGVAALLLRRRGRATDRTGANVS